MRASDVMVTNVITVTADTSVKEIAEILLTRRISAVPVVDGQGGLLGIVSEGDLIHRVEAGTERHYSWWLDLFCDKSERARDYLKSHALRADQVMTRPVITAPPDMPLAEVAHLLEKNRIKRVPIVEAGKIVGIVSRANLLQALSGMRGEAASPVDDATLRAKILAEINGQLWASASHLNVIVRNGAVELWGGVGSQDEKEALRVAAELVPGVKSVADYVAVSKIHSGI